MGVLPASSFRVSGDLPQGLVLRDKVRFRTFLTPIGFCLWVLFLVPPFWAWTGRYEFVQAIQFCLFAVVIPVLLVAGVPWRWLRMSTGEQFHFSDDGALVAPLRLRRLDRSAFSRATRPGHQRVVVLVLIFIGQSILWRSSPVVNALVRDKWLAVIESLALISAGVFLWLDLIESPPFSPRTTRPYRIGISAVAMWTIWVITYLMAMAHNSWYPAIHHVPGQGLSQSADQQLTAAIMWFMSAVVFLPVVFSNLNRWLLTEDNPDDELYRLVRQNRARGFFGTGP